MLILCFLFLITGSCILLIWLLRITRHDPYPKSYVAGMLAWGGWVAVLIGVLFTGMQLVGAMRAMGIGIREFWDWFMANDLTELDGDPSTVADYYSIKNILWANFFTAAIPEEVAKYLVAMAYLKQVSVRKNIGLMDAIFCSSVTAIGFQLTEDLLYLGEGLSTAILRGIIPFHFTYGACMGYFIGKAITTGKKSWHMPALVVPIVIHGLFDTSIYLIDLSDWMLLVFLIIYLQLMGLTAGIIAAITKYAKKLRTDASKPAGSPGQSPGAELPQDR